MAYLTQEQLEKLKFKYLGKNVKISEFARIYNPEQMEIGDNSRIDDFCVLSGKVKIGRNVQLAVFCNVAGGFGGVVFEDFSGFAYYVNVFTQSDDYSGETLTNATVPRQYKKEKFGSVIIGKHALVGSNAVIFPDAHIAEGCSVAATSLVTVPTKPWGIYIGNPARRFSDRRKDLLELESEYLNNEK